MTPDELAPLRVTAALAGWCGLLALVAAQLLSPAVGFAGGALVALVSLNASMYHSQAARQLRKQLGFVALAVALLYVAVHLSSSLDAFGLARTLPPLLIGVLTAAGLGADKRHDVMASVLVGEFMIVLAAGVSPRPWLAVPLVLGWVLAIVALVQSHQLHAADCSAPALRSAIPARPRGLGTAATAATLAVAIGLLLFLVLPQPSGSAAQRRFGRPGNGGRDTQRSGEGSRLAAGGPLDMRTRGDLGNRPVAEVPVDSPQLWRSGIYETYDGTQWNTRDAPSTMFRPGHVVLPPDPLDEGVRPAGPQRTDEVRVRAGFDGLVISPGTPVALMSSGRAGALGAARILVEDRSGFTVTSIQPETDPGALSAASGPDPDERWLQLPASLPARVGVLARQVAGSAPSRPAAVEAISRYLGTHKKYDLNSPVPPPGADAVDDFLFRVDSGFCEQFAAAEVVLLRTLGVPTRMATGFGYGSDQANGRRLFSSGNAHAWVEVWYPGVGWSPTDPTPPSVQAAAKPHVSAFSRLVKWVQRLLGTTRGRLTVAAVIVLLGAACFGVGWLRRRRTPIAAPALPGAWANSLLTAFARLEAALVADGRPRGPGETLAELERRLGAGAAGRRALATLELAIYSPQLVPPADARAAAHAFEQLASSILAAHAARGLLAGSIGVRT